ncbi:MAG: helix-hairpin-helix domain-containing protein [Phycisphaerales bacterium]|nr:helix-hairpin-helix domain-containing protein [Phycisphaerales bacterium]
MISSLHGELREVNEQVATIQVGPIGYDVMLPAGDVGRLRLAIGQPVDLTVLHYLESQSNGAVFRPRLIGFANDTERSFFELFTSVKGIGYRKALRALAMPMSTVARAIAERDADTLRALPEIGKRTAETIVLDLAEKVEQDFAGLCGGDGADAEIEGTAVPDGVRDAITVLVQLGEARTIAVELVDRVRRADPTITDADALVAAALRLKDTVN